MSIDDKVYDLAIAYAKGRGITLGAALSELVRRRDQAPTTGVDGSPRLVRNEHGYFEIAETRHAVTPAMVKETSEDEVA